MNNKGWKQKTSEGLAEWLFGNSDGCSAVIIAAFTLMLLGVWIMSNFNDRGLVEPKTDLATEPEYNCGSVANTAVVVGERVLAFERPRVDGSAIWLTSGTYLLVGEAKQVSNKIDGRFWDYTQDEWWVEVSVPQLGQSLWVKGNDLDVDEMNCILE